MSLVHHADREIEMMSALVELTRPSGLLCNGKPLRNCDSSTDVIAFVAPLVTFTVTGWPLGSSSCRSTRFQFVRTGGCCPHEPGSSFRAPRDRWTDPRRFASHGIRSLDALPPTWPSRVHSQSPPEEDDLWQLAATLTARSVLVVFHHYNGLRRVTASGVLQPVPVRVRCVSVLADHHRVGKPSPGGTCSNFPAARAPFEEPSASTGDPTSLWCRYPR